MLRATALLLGLSAAALPAVAGPLAHDPCADAAQPQPFAANPRDLENLHFHDGALYVTGGDAKLHRFGTDGTDSVVADLGARAGAMVTGSDGALYVRVGGSEVWRFGVGPPAVVAAGMQGANGMAVDAAGNIYVSSESGDVVYKLPSGNPGAWTVWAQLYSPNGLVVDDAAGVLYAAQTTDGRSTIAAIDLADPSQVHQVASLSFGFAQADLFDQPPLARLVEPSDLDSPLLPKGLDDLTLVDGMLYAAAWVTGEVLRVDPATGAACALATGIAQPSSVRAARGFGGFDGDLFITDFGGPLQLLTDTPQDAHISVVPLG